MHFGSTGKNIGKSFDRWAIEGWVVAFALQVELNTLELSLQAKESNWTEVAT